MQDDAPRFPNRAEAGRRLAAALRAADPARPIVYALPRGGVPVAVEVARALNAPLDLVLVRKIGAPGSPELALGALVEGDPPETVLNEDVRRMTGATEAYLARETAREAAELNRRRERYMAGRPHADPTGRTAIVVDDGLATGATMKAALVALRRWGAARLVVAVPVSPASTLDDLHGLANQVICLAIPPEFYGVGAVYDDFHQLTDTETVALLRDYWQTPAA